MAYINVLNMPVVLYPYVCKLHGDCVWFVSYYTCFSQAANSEPLGYTPTAFNNTV